MGSRRLKSVLLNPTYDVEWLNREYEKVAICLEHYDDVVTVVRKMLKGVCDVEKIIRKIVLGRFNDIVALYGCINLVKQLLGVWGAGTGATMDETVAHNEIIVCNLLQFFETHFVLGCAATSGYEIKCGIDSELDGYIREHQLKRRILDELITELNRIYNKSMGGTRKAVENAVKIHTTEKSGISLTITKTRGKQLKGVLGSADGGFNIADQFIDAKEIKFVSATSSGNEDTIKCPFIDTLCEEIVKLEQTVADKTGAVFSAIMKTFEEVHLDEIKKIAKWIAEIDLCCTKAYIAREYNYNRPVIAGSATDDDDVPDKSYLMMRDLRHVLIEHLVKTEMYVPNDVELGCGLAKDGLLIFGTNMIGKTSLIRAVGIAVFIAQCGFYVPCSSMRYWPYRAVMTRIVCNDNLFKGISTFAMEMIELRIILRDADKRTLVLGDELGASTEHKSAFSIFVATLMELSRRECTFLFTTHFYEILKMDELGRLARLALCHLEVSFDGEKLVYNRKLKDGAGLANYGLECCKSMYFGAEFMEMAYGIRNKYYPELAGVLNWEKSTYNARKLKGVCEKCGEKMGEEIHHKMPQADADKDGFLLNVAHKNVVGNLMSLCEKCHLNEHLLKTHVPTKSL